MIYFCSSCRATRDTFLILQGQPHDFCSNNGYWFDPLKAGMREDKMDERPRINGLKVYDDTLSIEMLTERLKRDKWDTGTICRVHEKHKGVRGDYYYYVTSWAARAPYGYWYTFSSGNGRNGKTVVRKSMGCYSEQQWQDAQANGKIILL